jgi:acetolactate decarboxylase
LTEVTKNQAVFEFHDIEGTIVGFRCPPYVSGINVPGYHLHFLTKDRAAGGHVLDFIVGDASMYIDDTSEFTMSLPGQDSDFYDPDLSQGSTDEIEKVEK